MARPTILDYKTYTKEVMEDLYIKQNLSRGRISEVLGLPESQVRCILHHWRIVKSAELQRECQKKGTKEKSATGWYRESSLRNWQDPVIRAKRLEGMAKNNTAEWRQKISKGLKGRQQSESQKQKMRELWAQGKWDFFRDENYWDVRRAEWSKKGKEQFNNLSAEEQEAKREHLRQMSQSEEIRSKRTLTRHKRKTFGKSKWEDYFYRRLIKVFPNTKRQYKSQEYPFHCDFYVPEKRLYIELQLFWVHGERPYQGTEEDKEIVEFWRSKGKRFYNNAIYIWTDLDVRKRTIAKENNLNYIELFTRDECEAFLKTLS